MGTPSLLFLLLSTAAGPLVRRPAAQVLRDFKAPDGVGPDDMDAGGDGEVLVVLDLRMDDSLLDAGLAREVVNRFQKLRKSSGLTVQDKVRPPAMPRAVWPSGGLCSPAHLP